MPQKVTQVDSSGDLISEANPLDVALDVNQSEAQPTEARVMDESVAGLLTQVLQELRMLNLHMMAITDEVFDPQDTE